MRSSRSSTSGTPGSSAISSTVPKDKADPTGLDPQAACEARCGSIADRFRPKLIELLGEEKGKAVKYAEAFEICEYGSQPSREELHEIFPFFGRQ